MNRTLYVKISLDFLMMLTLLFLMTRSLVSEVAHEWAGSGMFVLFVVHYLLNLRWSRNIFRGRYTFYRIFQTLLVIGIGLAMLSLMASGILLSKHVYFIEIQNLPFFARTLHLLASYWGFVLTSVHLGLHGTLIIAMITPRQTKNVLPPCLALAYKLLALLFAAYGCYAFLYRSIPSYLFYQMQFAFFDFEEPLWRFIADYVAIMWFFVLTSHYMTKGLKTLTKHRDLR